MPKVSVIIPVYNGEEFIQEALDSVIAQTFGDYEIIVVNDGSTDGTAAAMGKYGDRIICVHQENRGLAVSREVGLQASRGEWVAFLDADDIWFPEKLERQVRQMESHPECGIVATDILSFEGEEVISASLKDRYQPRSGYVAESLLFGNWITPSAAMVRRECFEKVRTFDVPKPSFGEDWLMWMQIAPHYPVCFLDEVLVRRRLHSHNMTRVEENQFDCLLRNFDIVQKFVPEIGNRPKLVRKALYKICMNRGRQNLTSLQLDFARDKFSRAIGYKSSLSLAHAYLTLTVLTQALLQVAKRCKGLLKAAYLTAVPSWLRSWVYQWRHPEYRLELKISNICRRGIETFLDSLVEERTLTGKFLEIGAGERQQNKTRFGPQATLYCRSDLVPSRGTKLDVLCDCTNLGFSSGSLDVVICSEVLEHVAQIQEAIAELGRVLREGGYLVITIPFFYPLHGLDAQGNGDYWRLTPGNLKRLLGKHFVVVRESTCHLIHPRDPFVINQQFLLRRL